MISGLVLSRRVRVSGTVITSALLAPTWAILIVYLTGAPPMDAGGSQVTVALPGSGNPEIRGYGSVLAHWAADRPRSSRRP